MSLKRDPMTDVVERAWRDPDFKQRLLSDPKAALAELGIKVPADLDVRVVENTETLTHLTIPAAPQAPDQLSEDELRAVAACGGTSWSIS